MDKEIKHPWKVEVSKKARKQLDDLPDRQAAVFDLLILDLTATGPVQGSWPNYSKLGQDMHHCHLSPKWVACWQVVNKSVRVMEVYYVGSRKDAPY